MCGSLFFPRLRSSVNLSTVREYFAELSRVNAQVFNDR